MQISTLVLRFQKILFLYLNERDIKVRTVYQLLLIQSSNILIRLYLLFLVLVTWYLISFKSLPILPCLKKINADRATISALQKSGRVVEQKDGQEVDPRKREAREEPEVELGSEVEVDMTDKESKGLVTRSRRNTRKKRRLGKQRHYCKLDWYFRLDY